MGIAGLYVSQRHVPRSISFDIQKLEDEESRMYIFVRQILKDRANVVIADFGIRRIERVACNRWPDVMTLRHYGDPWFKQKKFCYTLLITIPFIYI